VEPGDRVLLSCRGVQKRWGGVRALADLDFDVSEGEIVGIAGANGAGKSTLLNAIGGQIAVNRGDILLHGRSIEKVAAHRRRALGIGRTFQTVRVFAGKSALLNVALASQYGNGHRWLPPLRFRPGAVAAARDALRVVQLEHVEGVPAGELSVYDQKRLMLAMAIVPKPELLLLDEPAGGLSPQEVEDAVALVKALRAQGTTVVVVDHVMSFLVEVAERVVVLHDGGVLCEGLPATVVQDPRVREAWLGDVSKDSTAA
jgi:ABC-type branched-subunit amino acid transport system ATPase component